MRCKNVDLFIVVIVLSVDFTSFELGISRKKTKSILGLGVVITDITEDISADLITTKQSLNRR